MGIGRRFGLRGTTRPDSSSSVSGGERRVSRLPLLTPGEAGRLATFITGGLADLATEGLIATKSVAHLEPRLPLSTRFRRALKTLRCGAASSLESIARRLR